jgi:pimeloyl-ACP methyl ester carboxylesterase
MLSVPVDYSKPDGDVAQIAMIRFKATGQKVGSLVVNPGGPGESGVEAAASMAPTLPQSVRERFDLVGFDPRGVANSTPAAWCNSDEDNDKLRADPTVEYTQEGVDHIEKENKEFVQRCVDKMGKEFLANLGTANVAKDLEAIRTGLGDDKLTYLGYSYGTRIGGCYAEAYPDKVRAMILDGADRPNADPIEEDIRQDAAFQKAFDDYAADCAKDPTCPLGTDPAKAVDVYKSLVEPLVDKPRQDRGSARPRATATRSSARSSAVFAEHLAATHRRPQRAQRRARRHAAAVARICTCTGMRTAITTTPPMSASRSTASTSRASPTAPSWSRRTAGLRELAPFLSYGEVHRLRADGHVCVLAGPADNAAARDLRQGPAAIAGDLHDERSRQRRTRRRRPGQAARRHAASPSKALSTPSPSRATRASTTSSPPT